jgi:phosphohistidine phosphatase
LNFILSHPFFHPMKYLTLIRHAKALPDSPSGEDFDRTLAPRGIADADRMGGYLKDKYQLSPQAMRSSLAPRALATAQKIATGLGFPVENILQDRSIYEAPLKALRPDLPRTLSNGSVS